MSNATLTLLITVPILILYCGGLLFYRSRQTKRRNNNREKS